MTDIKATTFAENKMQHYLAPFYKTMSIDTKNDSSCQSNITSLITKHKRRDFVLTVKGEPSSDGKKPSSNRTMISMEKTARARILYEDFAKMGKMRGQPKTTQKSGLNWTK